VAHLKVGETLIDKEDFPEAGRHFGEALRLNPEADEAAGALGFVLEKQGLTAAAAAAYAQALRIDPKNARAHGNLGRLLLGPGTFDEGVAHLREAVRLDPTFLGDHYHLGRALLVLGRPEEARRHFSIAYGNLPEAERQAWVDAALRLSRQRPRDPRERSDSPAGR
jgi:Flp pilus assembly protein TadD